MCGRYRASRRRQIIEEHFDASGEEDWNPRYSIAPTQPVPGKHMAGLFGMLANNVTK